VLFRSNENAADSHSALYFHLYPNAFQPQGWIEIFDVLFNDTSLTYTISGIDESLLWVDLVSGSGPGMLVPGQNVTLDLIWQIMIPERFDRFGVTIETEDFDFLAFNLGNWHPIVSVYDERGWAPIGWTTNVIYKAPPEMTDQEVIEFYVQNMGQDWQGRVEEVPIVEVGTGEQKGRVLHVEFSRGTAIVSVNTDNMFEGGPHTFEVAIDCRGAKS